MGLGVFRTTLGLCRCTEQNRNTFRSATGVFRVVNAKYSIIYSGSRVLFKRRQHFIHPGGRVAIRRGNQELCVSWVWGTDAYTLLARRRRPPLKRGKFAYFNSWYSDEWRVDWGQALRSYQLCSGASKIFCRRSFANQREVVRTASVVTNGLGCLLGTSCRFVLIGVRLCMFFLL